MGRPKKDLTGMTFNYLNVINDSGGKKVLCRCLLCGTEKEVNRDSLLRGHSKSCGCLSRMISKKNATDLAKRKDLTGKVFPGVQVLQKTDQKQGTQRIYKCKCLHCGKIFFVNGSSLTSGATTSCGCERIKLAIKNITKDCVDGTKITTITSKKLRSDNSSGIRGVAPCPKGWIAYIGFKGKRYVLYQGADKNEAIKRRREAEQKYFKPFLDNLKNNQK